MVLEPQMPHGMEGIRKLEESLYRSEQAPVEDAAPQPPRFVTEIQSQEALFEGQPAHFDCRVEPVGDPSMRIEWFHNGRPVDVGSRSVAIVGETDYDEALPVDCMHSLPVIARPLIIKYIIFIQKPVSGFMY